MQQFINKILNLDALSGLRLLPDACVQTVVTSPPYWGKRNYGDFWLTWGGNEHCQHDFALQTTTDDRPYQAGLIGKNKHDQSYILDQKRPQKTQGFCRKCGAWHGELGQEPTPELFVEHLVLIFREVRRVLKPDSTLWLNLGDTYWGGKGKSGTNGKDVLEKRRANGETLNHSCQEIAGHGKTRPQDGRHPYLKPKDLCLIPAMVAIALQKDGWWLRDEIIWHKPNGMPESVTDRCVSAHEKIYLFAKSKAYYFDYKAIQSPIEDVTVQRMLRATSAENKYANFDGNAMNGYGSAHSLSQPKPNVNKPNRRKSDLTHNGDDESMAINGRGVKGHSGYFDAHGNLIGNGYANARNVWRMPTAQFSEGHFATFPEELPRRCILAGSRLGDLVLDPFMGGGTTALVARKAGRDFVGFEINREYHHLAEARLNRELLGLKKREDEKPPKGKEEQEVWKALKEKQLTLEI